MQKRLVRKLDLEMLLSRVPPNPSPKPNLEQYTIPANVASTMLYIAAYVNNDIVGKAVLDLGCGTGRLALGAAFLGAEWVVGVDLDRNAVSEAHRVSQEINLGRKLQWVVADIGIVHGRFDTVLQNPPYGVQKRGSDVAFLERALKLGKTVYSLHKSPHSGKTRVKRLKASSPSVMATAPSLFLEEFIESNGGKIKAVYAMVMTVPHMFDFHNETKHEFVVDLYVIEGKRET
jgi:putative methylase